MKRFVSVALAVMMLSGTAAAAAPYDHGGQEYYRGHRDGDGGAVVAGIGLIALAAILASQHRHHHHYGWYGHDGYNRGYDGGFGDRYRGYGDGYAHRYQGYGYDNQYQGYGGYGHP